VHDAAEAPDDGQRGEGGAEGEERVERRDQEHDDDHGVQRVHAVHDEASHDLPDLHAKVGETHVRVRGQAVASE
jgi:hypothetical protein